MNHAVTYQGIAEESKLTTAISHHGFEFNYLDRDWILSRNITLNLRFLSEFKQPLREDIRETLLYFAENNSPHYVKNITGHLNVYLRLSGEDIFSELGFLSFKNKSEKKLMYKISFVRSFLRQMRFLGLASNIDDSVYELTDQWRLGGNDKGGAVLSLDPETGPFSDLEFEAIGLSAAHKFANGILNTEGYMCLSLFKATGRRPEQLASLKCKDFSYSSIYTGTPSYVVNIPKAKVRGGRFRSILTPFGLINYIGQLTEQHIKQQTSNVEVILGRKLTENEKREIPLFLDIKAAKEMKSIPPNELLVYLKSELPHITSRDIVTELNSIVKKLCVISERTGRRIRCSGYRFRYTLGTRAAIQGAGTITIARLLDHSDTQNVNVYVANVPEFAVEISKIMNQPLARYASAFIGRVVKDESEANTENAGATRIPCREKGCDVGSCGTKSFCQDYAPIACYLCPKFRPWSHAPHHLILQWLMEERERLKTDTNGDMQIVTINDRAIIAVCQVIRLCQEHNNG
ncbi:site-specific integrase [Photobacterium phosphoreum]|uniref:site-specific integrase n=1 Tax=Photobacterium phosphoreum TaxID=659 RepID=UPI0007F93F69|nr:site-specific integrase [Photobacterium phosphoreum]OBU31958.1 integrase [Photobacterium phosphoreum]